MKFCLHCGEAIPEGSHVCPVCGKEVDKSKSENEHAVVYATQNTSTIIPIQETEEEKKESRPKPIAMILLFSLLLLAALLIVSGLSKANLKKKMLHTWYAQDASLIKVLDISDDSIEYRLETGYSWLNTSLGNFEWKVIGAHKIKINRFGNGFEKYKVEINKDNTILIVTPAITEEGTEETWYNIE